MDIDDVVMIQMNAHGNFKELIRRYHAEVPSDISWNKLGLKYEKYFEEFSRFNYSCSVAGFSNQSYGKVEKRAATTAVYMEYDTIYKHWANYLSPE